MKNRNLNIYKLKHIYTNSYKQISIHEQLNK